MKKHILIFLFLQFFIGAQDSDKLKSLQDKFESIRDLSVNIMQKSGGAEILSGKLYYKNGNKFNLDLKNNIIVSDGSTIWNYNKRENKVIINAVDKSDPSYFSFNTFVYDFPSQCVISSEQNGEVLVLAPKTNSELNFVKAKLWINKDNLVSKVLLEGTGAGNTEINFSNYRLNQNISESQFNFIPPEGSTIIDLR